VGRALQGIGTRADAGGEGEESILLLDVDHLMRRIREERE